MPDVRASSSEKKVVTPPAVPQRDADDEITRIASKVLSDLESFVDESIDTDDDELVSGVIGVSLDELRLILDTSIRRHVDTEASPRHPVEVPVEPLLPREKNPRLQTWSRVTSSSIRSPLSELQQLLQTKQQQFCRIQEENRAVERVSRFTRDQREEKLPIHRPRRDQRMHRDRKNREERLNHKHWQEWPHSATAFRDPSELSSRSSSSSASKASRQDRVRPVNNQATETDDVWRPRPLSPPESRPEILRAEKACNISPFELGPAISDLPAATALNLSGQPQSPGLDESVSYRSSRRHRDTKRSSGSRGSQSGWSSSSSSSYASSSVRSESPLPQARRLRDKGHSQGGVGDTESNLSLQRSQHQRDQQLASPPTAAEASQPTVSAPEQLEWELDLSNINI